MILAITETAPSHAEEIPLEYRIKANYLLNIPLFVGLPPPEQGCSSFNICMIGDNPMESILLTSSREKTIRNRPVKIKVVDDADQLGCCQVLFIASSERYRLQKLLTEANRRRILTISDMRDFIRHGGMINLVSVNNRITFDLNRRAAQNASITFSTHLLKLANDVSN